MERWASDNDKAALAKAIREGLRFGKIWSRRESRWFPSQVNHPDKRRPFIAQEAWLFILKLLERGEPVERLSLRKPPGAPGWVIKVPDRAGRRIYIKLETTDAGYIYGRSFHYSDHDARRDPKEEDDE